MHAPMGTTPSAKAETHADAESDAMPTNTAQNRTHLSSGNDEAKTASERDRTPVKGRRLGSLKGKQSDMITRC